MPFLKPPRTSGTSILDINFKGALRVIQAVVPGMIERGFGRVINIGSDAGRVGSSLEAVYSGAKGGIIAFTKTLAREVATKGVTVNTVCPGPTDTPALRKFADNSGEDADKVDRRHDPRRAHEAAGPARRRRRCRRLLRLRRRRLHHRPDAVRQRRTDDGLMADRTPTAAWSPWNRVAEPRSCDVDLGRPPANALGTAIIEGLYGRWTTPMTGRRRSS